MSVAISFDQLDHGEWALSIENWSKADYQRQVSAKSQCSG
jgi:hypothetical protein